MIYLSNTATSSVTVTLYENCRNLVNPYFTWTLIKKGSLEVIIFYQDDSSPAPYYYNSFTLSVSTASMSPTYSWNTIQYNWNTFDYTWGNTTGLTAGIIPVYPGEYNYCVYEMTDPYILSTQSAVGLVESGILIVEGTQSVIPSYSNAQYQIPVYKNKN